MKRSIALVCLILIIVGGIILALKSNDNKDTQQLEIYHGELSGTLEEYLESVAEKGDVTDEGVVSGKIDKSKNQNLSSILVTDDMIEFATDDTVITRFVISDLTEIEYPCTVEDVLNDTGFVATADYNPDLRNGILEQNEGDLLRLAADSSYSMMNEDTTIELDLYIFNDKEDVTEVLIEEAEVKEITVKQLGPDVYKNEVIFDNNIKLGMSYEEFRDIIPLCNVIFDDEGNPLRCVFTAYTSTGKYARNVFDFRVDCGWTAFYEDEQTVPRLVSVLMIVQDIDVNSKEQVDNIKELWDFKE